MAILNGKEAQLLYHCHILSGIILNFNETDISPHHTTIMSKLNEVLNIDQMDVVKTALDKSVQDGSEKVISAFSLHSWMMLFLQIVRIGTNWN